MTRSDIDQTLKLLRIPRMGVAIMAACLMILAASSLILSGNSSTRGDTEAFRPVARVEAGPFDIEVTETATLDARQSVTLSSALPSNTAKILFLAAEGSIIREGEIVARFDPSPFEEYIAKLDSEIDEARAIVQQGEAELELLKADADAKESRLEQQLSNVRVKLENLQQSEIPLRLSRAEKQLNHAETDYRRARQAVATEEKLIASGLSKKADLTLVLEAEKEKKIELDMARRNYNNQQNLAPNELRQAQLAVEHGVRELESHREIVYTQSLAKHNAGLARSRGKLAELEQARREAMNNLERTVLTAPVSGQLLFMKISLGNERRRVQVGDSLWQHQAFAVIPDMNAMIARSNVRESEIGKLQEGQQALIYPDAYPSLELRGHLESIGSLVVGEGHGNAFEVRVALEQTDSRLRPGMNARARILARHYEHALRIPVEAVFYQERKPVCFLWQSGRPLRVPVTLGDSDGRHVIVQSGLQEGQEVLLVMPNSQASLP
ncbi:MAG: HlyD family efflux transporter periplasmic adaptor subunit [Porticoccaceae bacterium]